MVHVVPRGFRLAGVRCGLKKDASRLDLALVAGDADLVAAGVYTRNLIYAAPVALDRQRTPSHAIRVVVANSGNANACTGDRGLDDARNMAAAAANALGARPEQALVLSTGIIGEYLPMPEIHAGITAAAGCLDNSPESLLNAARGIMTTDRYEKIVSRSVTCADSGCHISGIAKGAGMIGPKMATMLAVIMTDATLTPETAQTILQQAVDQSFNCVSVEGHMSTNDTVLLLASGRAGTGVLEGADLNAFQTGLTEACVELARMIPRDGEGASHLITIEVTGTATVADARRIAETIANSPLVKTAIAGNDPNWGRIVSAAGYAGVPFDPHGVDLSINGTPLYEGGTPIPFDAASVRQSMQDNPEVRAHLKLSAGTATATFWTSDLTVDYVRLNADYHT